MQGVMVFDNLPDAIKKGYQVYERTKTGYTVRIRNNDGHWAFALVDLTKKIDIADHDVPAFNI